MLHWVLPFYSSWKPFCPQALVFTLCDSGFFVLLHSSYFLSYEGRTLSSISYSSYFTKPAVIFIEKYPLFYKIYTLLFFLAASLYVSIVWALHPFVFCVWFDWSGSSSWGARFQSGRPVTHCRGALVLYKPVDVVLGPMLTCRHFKNKSYAQKGLLGVSVCHDLIRVRKEKRFY